MNVCKVAYNSQAKQESIQAKAAVALLILGFSVGCTGSAPVQPPDAPPIPPSRGQGIGLPSDTAP